MLMPEELTGSWEKQTVAIIGRNFSRFDRVTVCWPLKCKQLPADQVTVVSPERIDVRIITGLQQEVWRIIVNNPVFGDSNSEMLHIFPPVIGI